MGNKSPPPERGTWRANGSGPMTGSTKPVGVGFRACQTKDPHPAFPLSGGGNRRLEIGWFGAACEPRSGAEMEAPMLSPDRIPNPMPLDAAAADYEIVRRAIGHIRSHWRAQPDIDAIAEAAGVTPTELHHLFRRWAGLTPKAFLQALTLDGARQLLRDSASVLDATYEVG